MKIYQTINQDVPEHIKAFQDDVYGYRAVCTAFEQLLTKKVTHIAFFCGDFETGDGEPITFTVFKDKKRVRLYRGLLKFNKRTQGYGSLGETVNYGMDNPSAIMMCALGLMLKTSPTGQIFRLEI